MGKISTYLTDKKYNGHYYSKEYNIMGKFQYIFITQKTKIYICMIIICQLGRSKFKLVIMTADIRDQRECEHARD